MGEEIGSIRIPIETDLQFQRAFNLSFDRLISKTDLHKGPLVDVYVYNRSDVKDPLQTLGDRIIVHMGVMEAPS